MTRKLLICTMILVFLLSLIPFLFYIYEFGTFSLATSKDEWGQFGDFIGGILNPFLSFASILILGYLTYEISRIEQGAQERSLEIQRKLVLGQLRQNAFEDYTRVIDNVLHNYDDSGKIVSESVGQKAAIAAEKIRTFNQNLSHLFPILRTDNLYKEVIKTFNTISFANSELLKTHEREDAVKLGEAVQKLGEEQQMIKERLQNFMMDELGK